MNNEMEQAAQAVAAGVVAAAQRATFASLENHLNASAKQAGKTTIASRSPSGSVLLWVTMDEPDPVNALLCAALQILVQRGQDPRDGNGAISIRKAMVAAPGANVMWQVTNSAGDVIAKGYAEDEAEAAARIQEHLTLAPK